MQRQLRLGDILDDYCPRERRVTNHAVVAMVGEDVKQTRCTTCDCDHEYKHAKVPRQRRKTETPAALYAQVLANGPKRVTHESSPMPGESDGASPSHGSDDAPGENFHSRINGVRSNRTPFVRFSRLLVELFDTTIWVRGARDVDPAHLRVFV